MRAADLRATAARAALLLRRCQPLLMSRYAIMPVSVDTAAPPLAFRRAMPRRFCQPAAPDAPL
jgi:hypothetical protein